MVLWTMDQKQKVPLVGVAIPTSKQFTRKFEKVFVIWKLGGKNSLLFFGGEERGEVSLCVSVDATPADV